VYSREPKGEAPGSSGSPLVLIGHGVSPIRMSDRSGTHRAPLYMSAGRRACLSVWWVYAKALRIAAEAVRILSRKLSIRPRCRHGTGVLKQPIGLRWSEPRHCHQVRGMAATGHWTRQLRIVSRNVVQRVISSVQKSRIANAASHHPVSSSPKLHHHRHAASPSPRFISIATL
jgi:hypothetical protein